VFHLVVQGQCCLQIKPDRNAIRLVSGDLVMLPQGHEHLICADLNSPVTHLDEMSFMPNYGYKRLLYGGGGELTELLSGVFQFRGERRNPLLLALPSLIHVKSEKGRLIPWLETTMQYITSEIAINQLGCQTIVARLADILFIQTVRAYIAEQSNEQGSWLQALTDAEIGIALSLMHRYPNTFWTVASLAEQIPMSRSAFAARFARLVGHPPMQYLTTWRMVKAAELLRESQFGIQEIAVQVGYESDVAFRKAFKRWSGTAPGRYRREACVPNQVLKEV
jgi:AraC family transcriptional regulator, alkane utilization regulator